MEKRYCWGCDREVEMLPSGEEGVWFCPECGCVFDDHSEMDNSRALTSQEVEAGEIY